jgi:hypothetical protein
MNKERISFKDEAHQALSRREWRKALESFQKHCAQEPEDLRSRQVVLEIQKGGNFFGEISSKRLTRTKEIFSQGRVEKVKEVMV